MACVVVFRCYSGRCSRRLRTALGRLAVAIVTPQQTRRLAKLGALVHVVCIPALRVATLASVRAQRLLGTVNVLGLNCRTVDAVLVQLFLDSNGDVHEAAFLVLQLGRVNQYVHSRDPFGIRQLPNVQFVHGQHATDADQ